MIFDVQALSKIACNRLQKELVEWQVNPPAGFKHKVTDNLQRYLYIPSVSRNSFMGFVSYQSMEWKFLILLLLRLAFSGSNCKLAEKIEISSAIAGLMSSLLLMRIEALMKFF